MNTNSLTDGTRAAGWHRLAKRTARRVNVAWWFSRFAPLLLGAGALGCAVLLILRTRGVTLPGWQIAAGLGALAAVAALAAWLLVRRRFCPPQHALVRLETQLGINNALSTASQGVTAWPEPPQEAQDALAADLRRVLLPVAGAAALVAAGFLIPIAASAGTFAPPPPRSHSEIQSAIDQLEQAAVLKKEGLEKLQKQLDELKKQDPSEWYSHANQEAADSMREGMSQSLREMARNLDKGVNTMNRLTQQEEMPPQEREQTAADFKQAMQSLANSPLGLNQKLQEQLSKLDPSKLKSLDQKQLKELQEQMEKAAGACEKCSGGENGEGQGEGEGKSKGKSEQQEGEGQGEGEGLGDGQESDPANSPGRGGVQRGPGVAPLPLAKQGSPQGNGNADSLESTDLSRARPGDAFGVSDAEHNPDKSPAGPQSGGAVNAPGAGGEAVGAESLVPADRAVLKRFFQ